MLKKALSFILAEIIALIGTLALIILYYSNKRKFINLDKIQDSLKSNKPIIFVSWHGRLVLMPFQRPQGQKVTAIVSRHFDGEVISKLIRNFGNSSIRGSTNRTKDIQKGSKNRGGSTVLRRSTKILENGENLAITPDGPKGPKRKFKKNILNIASKNNAIIIPISFSATKAKSFNSWDNFLLPLLFGKIFMIYGDPVEIPNNLSEKDIESYSKRIENDLNNVTDYVDGLTGRL